MNKYLPFELEINGLKCDRIGCGWKKKDVTFEEYKFYLESRCPVCGEVVLTQEQYDYCVKAKRFVLIMNILYFIPFNILRLFKKS